MRLAIAVCVAIWVNFIVACCCIPDAPKSTAPKETADAELQEKRKKSIGVYIQENVIDKVTGDKVAKMWVKPRFYSQPFEDKKIIASLVYTWFYKCPLNVKAEDTESGDHVQILDSTSGKQVGHFNPRRGLTMDK